MVVLFKLLLLYALTSLYADTTLQLQTETNIWSDDFTGSDGSPRRENVPYSLNLFLFEKIIIGDTHIPFGRLGKQLKLPQTAILAIRAPEQ